MTYVSKTGTIHRVEVLTEQGYFLPDRTRKDVVEIEGDRVVVYTIMEKGKLFYRTKYPDNFHSEYELVQEKTQGFWN